MEEFGFIILCDLNVKRERRRFFGVQQQAHIVKET
jgi:hypothetical protein